jgi:hypothetical protein
MSELQAFETVLGRSPKQAPIPLRVGAIDFTSKDPCTILIMQRKSLGQVRFLIGGDSPRA